VRSTTAQIILPAAECGRRTDLYVMMVSSAHCVAGKGKYIAIVSTTVETDDPRAELEPGVKLLGERIAPLLRWPLLVRGTRRDPELPRHL
jgi:Rab GDP dissociation inhibitor